MRSGSMRSLHLLVVVLALSTLGCSLLFVKGPPDTAAQAETPEAIDCTSGRGWPIFDTVYGSINTITAVALATGGTKSSSSNSDDTAVYAAGAVGSLALWGGSAYYGFTRTSQCREQKELALARQSQRRRREEERDRLREEKRDAEAQRQREIQVLQLQLLQRQLEQQQQPNPAEAPTPTPTPPPAATPVAPIAPP
jgi:hypothetical protein